MFAPVNLRKEPPSKKEQEEDHTREIEIENAFLTYQKAITLQESGDLIGAYTVYQQLSASSIIASHYYEESEYIRGIQNGLDNCQTDELGFIAQNEKNIRYLYLRNRSFLHLSIMRAGPETLEKVYHADRISQIKAAVVETPSDFLTSYRELHHVRLNFLKELFYTMLDNLVSSMMYQETDDTVLRLLFDVYLYLDFARLAKFTLELAQSLSGESDDIMSILPINDWATKLRKSFDLWQSGIDRTLPISLSSKLLFLEPIKNDLDVQCAKIMALNSVEVTIKTGADWADLIQSINSTLKQTQDREKSQYLTKYPDLNPYLASEFSCDWVIFKIIAQEEPPDVILIDDTEDIEVVMVVDDVKNVVTAENRNPPTADATVPTPLTTSVSESESLLEKTRISRRLNPDDSNPIGADGILLTRQFFIETEGFFDHINTFFGQFHPETPQLLQDVIQPLINPDSSNADQVYVTDFFRTLNEWKTNLYQTILFRENNDKEHANKANSDKVKLMEVLTRFGNHSSNPETTNSSEDDEGSEAVVKHLEELSSSRLHISALKLEILTHLLQSTAYKHWSSALTTSIIDWVNHCEQEIHIKMLGLLQQLLGLKRIQLCLGIYEILVDQFITSKNQLEESLEASGEGLKTAKSTTNNSSLKVLFLRDRIHKWSSLLEEALNHHYSDLTEDSTDLDIENKDFSSLIRYLWTTNYLVASESLTCSEKMYVVIHLQKLQELVNEKDVGTMLIPFPNYASIGEFSAEILHRRLSTASILAIFSKILDNGGLKIDANDDTIALLENILIEPVQDESMPESLEDAGSSLVNSVIHGRATLDEHSLFSVKEFLNECPVDLRLNLWNILFSYYQKDSFQKFQLGLEQYMNFMLSYLTGFTYLNLKERSIVLLQLLSSFDGYLKIFLKHLASSKWILPNSDCLSLVLLNLARLFELSYCFSLHEESALITGGKISVETKSLSSFEYFKDFVIDCITILLVYFYSIIRRESPDKLESFISPMVIMVHNQLGIRRLCDLSNGLFLRFAEDVLVSLLEVPDKELAQILSCRFHYKVKLNGQFPVDHYTEKVGKLDKLSAEELAAFILPFCFRRNPLTHNPRNDLKQIVEDLYEIIGDPDLEKDEILAANVYKIGSFCEQTMLTPRFMKESFHGLLQVLVSPLETKNSIADNGLYFMQAVLMFNFYKIRKKSAQSRTVELEKIVFLLFLDLAYGSDRVESWVLLGQAYGFLVEDDLLWTSDKLNIIERKAVTANSQRKALVGYLLAISTMTRKGFTEIDNMKSVVALLMGSFTKELYSACLQPMSMTAFMVYPAPRLVRQNGHPTIVSMEEEPLISKQFCLKLMLQCILLGIRSNKKDWSLYYYLAKIRAKLKQSPLEVLSAIHKASLLAKEYSIPGDLILEPSYKLFSLIYKYVKSGQIELQKALEFMHMDPMIKTVSDPAMISKDTIYICLVNDLSRLMTLDKKGWYHKPSYRQAFIVLNEFNDLRKAKECMAKYFSLRLTTKTFLQMWKPENERAGKHFVYMHQYARFYITVLTRERDLSSLVCMFPKLRKANSTMVQLYHAWDHMCSSFCRFIREVFFIEEGSVEKFLTNTNHAMFMSTARILVDSFSSDAVSEPVRLALCSLNVLSEMRKLNNGFGPTSLIDDTFTAFFLMVYNELVVGQLLSNNLVQDLPNGKVKRLAKKDLFPFATELTTKTKRFTDAYMKERPNLFNEFVSHHEARVKQIWAMQQMAFYQQRVQTLNYIQRIDFEVSAAKQWWQFEQKLAMKKMLFCTIPNSKKLIQEDEDELMELPSSLDSTAPSQKDRTLMKFNIQRFAMAEAYVAAIPPMEVVPSVYVNSASDSVAPVDVSDDETLPSSQSDVEIIPSIPSVDKTLCQRLSDMLSNPEGVAASDKAENCLGERENFPVAPIEVDAKVIEVDSNGTSLVVDQRSQEVADIKSENLENLDDVTDDVASTPPCESLNATPFATPKAVIQTDSPVETTSNDLPIETASSDLPVELTSNEPEPLDGISSKDLVIPPNTSKQDTIIAEPNEPIFVPRRRSSRQRENLLKSRMNGLSKDVPIVVEFEEDGPKRAIKSSTKKNASKRRK